MKIKYIKILFLIILSSCTSLNTTRSLNKEDELTYEIGLKVFSGMPMLNIGMKYGINDYNNIGANVSIMGLAGINLQSYYLLKVFEDKRNEIILNAGLNLEKHIEPRMGSPKISKENKEEKSKALIFSLIPMFGVSEIYKKEEKYFLNYDIILMEKNTKINRIGIGVEKESNEYYEIALNGKLFSKEFIIPEFIYSKSIKKKE